MLQMWISCPFPSCWHLNEQNTCQLLAYCTFIGGNGNEVVYIRTRTAFLNKHSFILIFWMYDPTFKLNKPVRCLVCSIHFYWHSFVRSKVHVENTDVERQCLLLKPNSFYPCSIVLLLTLHIGWIHVLLCSSKVPVGCTRYWAKLLLQSYLLPCGLRYLVPGSW